MNQADRVVIIGLWKTGQLSDYGADELAKNDERLAYYLEALREEYEPPAMVEAPEPPPKPQFAPGGPQRPRQTDKNSLSDHLVSNT